MSIDNKTQNGTPHASDTERTKPKDLRAQLRNSLDQIEADAQSVTNELSKYIDTEDLVTSVHDRARDRRAEMLERAEELISNGITLLRTRLRDLPIRH
jgi:hypothetical protein